MSDRSEKPTKPAPYKTIAETAAEWHKRLAETNPNPTDMETAR